jgi:AcrR family transcriptional regulator
VLAAAKDLFVVSAYDEVKAADIARAAGVAHGLVFHHFGSKEDLFREVLREVGRDVLARQVTDPAIPLGRRIRLSFRGHLEYLAAHHDMAVNLILRGPWPGAEQFDDIRDQACRRMCETLGVDFDRPAVRLAVRAFTSAADQVARDHLAGEYPVGIDEVVELLVDLLVGALHGARRVDREFDAAAVVSELGRGSAEPPPPVE